MHKNRFILPVLLVLFIGGCASVPRHPRFEARQQELKTLAILPPQVEVRRLTFKGDQAIMHELTEPVAGWLLASISTALEERGYRIQTLGPADRQSPEIQGVLYTVQSGLDQRLKEYKKGFLHRHFEYTLGSSVNRLADRTESDALLAVRCYAVKKTGGEFSKDVLKSVLMSAATLGNVIFIPNRNGIYLQEVLIDGDTGDILWLNENSKALGYDPAKEKDVRRLASKLARKLPKARRGFEDR